jgi:cystathionine gamma-lyase
VSTPDLPAELGDGTRLVHAGDDPAVPGAPLRPSPVFAAPYHLGDQPPGWQGADGYARPDNPTLRVFERAVGELDGGDCLSFATGMAAISSAVLALVRPGDRVVLPSDGYYATRVLARDELERLGLQVDLVPTLEIGDVAARGDLDGVRLVLLETPSNPQLDV